MFTYAQLNDSNIVISVQMVTDKLIGDEFIRVDRYNPRLISKKYNRETIAFEDVPQQEPEPDPLVVEKNLEDRINDIEASLRIALGEGGLNGGS